MEKIYLCLKAYANNVVLLEKDKYHKAAKALAEVTFNSLFARSVAEREVDGDVYVDDQGQPKTFYVIHPYGMALLLGNPGNKKFILHF